MKTMHATVFRLEEVDVPGRGGRSGDSITLIIRTTNENRFLAAGLVRNGWRLGVSPTTE